MTLFLDRHLPKDGSDFQRLLVAELGKHLGKAMVHLGIALLDGNGDLQGFGRA